jgi:hypothetical protein
MKEFMMIFRNDYRPDLSSSPEQMQEIMKSWMDWMGSMAAQNKLSSPGNRLGAEGKTVKPGNIITDGPYVEIKESVGGYIIVKANSIEEAAEMAKGCPILQVGGNVEVRNVIDMNS